MPVLTVEDLTLELNISRADAFERFFDFFGASELREEWSFSKGAYSEFAARNPVPPQSPRRFDLVVGATVRRASLLRAFGGRSQRGITVSSSASDIFAFTNPAEGASYGYDQHEGPRPDGSYAYTGEGPEGDQEFTHGNRLLRDAEDLGQTIRLFYAKGPRVTYLGAFTNGDPKYQYETISAGDKKPRQALIFNLVPVDADVSSLAIIPATGGEGVRRYKWVEPESSDAFYATTGEAGEVRSITRTEFLLQADFGAWLERSGTPPERIGLNVGVGFVSPDFYVPATTWIVEAKKSTARPFVRMAIGQVLDYANLARRNQLPAIPMILLPSRPEADLIELISSLGILLAVRSEDGFAVVDSPA
ncbi:hypothetical protein SAMN06295885_2392 [Rathayibacter oskolensis]|uniref:ScoMcrA-like SRA domain-containing protein n=1 Tax=Rathayibacter oskolensis TaxID=1891671 RepID=A0A1X7P316_9MICO|nr:hypothetical protein [Rathayibacter oskolensis]SMH44570.1 hypothetical protein SAMN06295885_2392 [Rathayibacter oskolensis]